MDVAHSTETKSETPSLTHDKNNGSPATTSSTAMEALRASKWDAASEEKKCCICLSPSVENECRTDACAHVFCLVCLQEWAKVKLCCPLCKTPFAHIQHSLADDGTHQV